MAEVISGLSTEAESRIRIRKAEEMKERRKRLRKDKEGRDGREDTDEDGWDFRDDEADEDDPVKPISREDDSENKAGGRGVIWLVVLVLIAAGGLSLHQHGRQRAGFQIQRNKKE